MKPTPAKPSVKAQSLNSPSVEPPPVQSKRPTADDLEDALAALDVDDPAAGTLLGSNPGPAKRPSSSAPRPLPGLPEQRPVTGPVRTVAHTVSRATPPAQTMPLPSARPPARPAPAAAAPPPSQGRTSSRPMTMPPPVPAAALRPKQPTQQVAVAPPAPKRATTDEGILIDFDDDDE